MKRLIMKRLILILLSYLAVAHGQPQSITLQAPAPTGPSYVNAQVSGTTGQQTYYYWVVANFAIGNSSPVGPALVRYAPDTLSASNKVVVSWSGVAMATGYDVLRTSTINTPTDACACKVTSTSSLTANDTSNSLLAYTVTGIAPATSFAYLNNRDYSSPRIIFDNTWVMTNINGAGIPTTGNLVKSNSSGQLVDGPTVVTSVGTPGLDTNIPTEKAVRSAVNTSSGTLTYYLQSTDSDLSNLSAIVTTDKKALTPPQAVKTAVDIANNSSGDVVLQSWATDPGFPGITFIPAGAYLFHIHSYRLSGNRAVTLYAVFREVTSTGTSVGTIGTQTESTIALGATEGEFTIAMANSNTYTMASSTSRIVVDLHAVFTGGATNTTVRTYVGGTADSHLSLPSNTVDATNFVPYSGATANLDLGTHTLVVGTLKPTADSATAVQINKADGSSNVVTVDTTNGRVGIATTGPGQKLSVTDTMSLTNTSGIQDFLMGNQDSSGANNPSMIAAAQGNLYFGHGSSWSGNGGTFTELMRIQNGGNVGIGTTNPGAKLTSTGDVFVTDSTKGVILTDSAAACWRIVVAPVTGALSTASVTCPTF